MSNGRQSAVAARQGVGAQQHQGAGFLLCEGSAEPGRMTSDEIDLQLIEISRCNVDVRQFPESRIQAIN